MTEFLITLGMLAHTAYGRVGIRDLHSLEVTVSWTDVDEAFQGEVHAIALVAARLSSPFGVIQGPGFWLDQIRVAGSPDLYTWSVR